jgi:hypothetical protein
MGVRRATNGDGWVLVHPRCARDRAEDIAEVREMIAADELDVATDELRWLLSGCSEFMEAHLLLGDLALLAGDVPLARGHFGFVVELGQKTLQRAKVSGPLRHSQLANRVFYEAGRGLVGCLAKLGLCSKAEELVEALQRLDTADPLRLRTFLDEVASGGLPMVDLASDMINNIKQDPPPA